MKAGVVICIPTMRNYINSAAAISLMNVSMETVRSGLADVAIVLCSDMPTDIARNYLVKRVQEIPEATHIFFADSDMVYPGDVIIKLLQHGKMIISALCYQRGPPFAPVIIKRSIENGVTKNRWVPYTDNMKNWLVKCDCTGLAATLINLATFDKLSHPYFKFIANDQHNEILTGEDIYFYDSCAKAGIDCIIDTSVVCEHIADTTMLVPQVFRDGWVGLGDKSIEKFKAMCLQ